ncbi:hypothetical protein [Aquimarina brevivitae]|uniref:Uncharacterized protein n=1 Tax=Aquimarina brevivitae TaxID=323412 RepID=A0A4Q7PHE0_9FLAO|nr:hypothetical protein [Aquimarina brevivitae]RZS99200.1 hypothetical protein EV197_0409 [Aquimarina brevivitae]
MSNIATLCSELKNATGKGAITFPNSLVTAVTVDDFIKNVLKTDKLTFSNATVACSGSKVTLTGNFILFGVHLTASWGFTEESDGSITWSLGASSKDLSTVNTMVKHFLTKTFTLPANLSGLSVTSISFNTNFNTTDKKYSLDLDAKTSWGEVELFVKNNSGTWGAALGIGVSQAFNLSKIDSTLTVFNDLQFSDSAIVISDFKDDKLKIVGITGVVDGVEFVSTLALQANAGKTPLQVLTNEMSKSLQNIPLQISIDLTKTSFEVKAAIEKSFGLPGYSKIQLSGIEMDITSTPSISLQGTLELPIKIPAKPDVNEIQVTGAISFTYSDGTGTIQATLNSDTEIIYPFDFYGVTLEDVGVGLDVSFGVETGAGITLEGAFLLGQAKTKLDEKFAITMEFTDDLPNPSLLYCETKNLSLPVIFNSVIDSGITLPKALSEFSFEDLMFYWCDKAQQLPDGTQCQVGIGYNAAIDFWGFHTYSALMINQGTGIKGQASIDPINLLDGSISLTGKGQAGHDVKAGGAYFDFDTTVESFDVSVDAEILGMEEVVDASVSPTALDIHVQSNLGFLEDKIDVKFKDGGTKMSFDSSLSIGINAKPSITIGGINLGTITINDTMTGTLSVSFINGALSALVDASFDFNGEKFGFKFDVGTNLRDLGNLAQHIEQKIVAEATSIFASYFADVTNYISVLGKGLISGGAFVVNVLYHVYKTSIPQLFEALAKLPDSYHVDGTVDFPIKIAPGIPSESFHADLGHLVNVHADKHADLPIVGGHHFSEHADLDVSKSVSTPAFNVTLIDIDPSQHFDMMMPPAAHADATSPPINVSEHLDAAFVGGDLGVSGNVGVNSNMVLNSDISLHAHLNATVHGGVNVGIHGDILHIGIHADKHEDAGTHVDKGI